MKRRRRHGEKYEGLPYPTEFKRKMLEMFPGDESLEAALDGGWDSIGRWFDELCNIPSLTIFEILKELENVNELRAYCEYEIERRRKLIALDDEWQHIVFLDDQNCKPWEKINAENNPRGHGSGRR
jgi:hypothetical protein